MATLTATTHTEAVDHHGQRSVQERAGDPPNRLPDPTDQKAAATRPRLTSVHAGRPAFP
jgi:hypothetical protein